MINKMLPFLIFFLSFIPAARAGITAVTLSPDGATLCAAGTFAVGEVSFDLPSQADPATLTVTCRDRRFRLNALTWQRDEAGRQAAVTNLIQAIDDLKKTRAQTMTRLDTARAEAGLWQAQTGRAWDKAEDALAIARNLKAPLQAVLDEKLALETAISALDRQIAEKEQQLAQLRGDDQKQWRVRLALDGPQGEKTRLEWSFFVTGCGFEPRCRLDARPDQHQILFSLDASIWQHTGMEWKDVTLKLASTRPAFGINPPANDPWIMVPLEIRPYTARKNGPTFGAGTDMVMLEAMAAPEAVVGEIRKATYTEWTLGRITLKPGEPQLVPVKSAVWPARFMHLLRPEKSPQAYLEATVTLDEALDVPPGTALHLVDGAMVGQQTVTLKGRELQLYFGADPLVGGSRRLVEYKTGQNGLIRDRKSWHWLWETAITNSRSEPVGVRVEESRPQARSEKISLQITASPEATEQTSDNVVRLLTLPAGSSQTITLDVKAQTPADMDIHPGR